MDLSLSARDYAMAGPLANITDGLDSGGAPVALRNEAIDIIGPLDHDVFIAASAVCPQFAVFNSADATLIVICGAKTSDLIASIVVGYSIARFSRPPDGTTSIAVQGATVIIAAINSASIPVRDRIIVAGHSWGGVVGFSVVSGFKRTGIGTSISLCTFGSPRPSDDRLPVAVGNTDIARFMNEGDKVPEAPPRPRDAAFMYALLPSAVSTNWQEFIQVGQGIQLHADRGPTFTMLPGVSSNFTDLSLAGFFISNEAPVAIEHKMSLYASRLRVLQLQEAALNQPHHNAANAEQIPIPFTDPASRDRPRIPVPQQVIVDSVRPPQVFADRSLPYYSMRLNRQHVVQYEGQTIAVCKGGKSARNLAASLNTSWRRWNRTRVGDASALVGSVYDAFLE